MKRNIVRYWPRLLGWSLLLLLSGSLERNAGHHRHDSKQTPQAGALQQRSLALPQGGFKVAHRLSGFLPSHRIAFQAAGQPHAVRVFSSAPVLHHAQETWRSDAPRPPPLPA